MGTRENNRNSGLHGLLRNNNERESQQERETGWRGRKLRIITPAREKDDKREKFSSSKAELDQTRGESELIE